MYVHVFLLTSLEQGFKQDPLLVMGGGDFFGIVNRYTEEVGSDHVQCN